MHTLENRIVTTTTEAATTAAEAVTRATTKGVALENVKRTYHDFIHQQASAAEFAAKKLSLAKETRDKIESAIADLDARLVEFESQLRKEGRWPAPETSNGLAAKAPRAKPVALPKQSKPPVRSPSPDLPTGRTVQKARRRESGAVGVANPTTPRAAALAAARAAEAAAKAEAAAAEEAVQVQKDVSGDVVMDVADPGSGDQTPYCVCRSVSQGAMVACEGKNCKIEWFHFECVGLKEEPKGEWFCDDCLASVRRKSSSSRRKAT